MPSNYYLSLLLCVFSIAFSFSQEEKDSTNINLDKNLILVDSSAFEKKEIDPLRPAKAAFFSAILPGLGQAYNKKYWKVPIALGGVGIGVYFYIRNDVEYDRYRDAFKRRLAGFKDDEFFGDGVDPLISNDGLERAQDQFRRNKELSLLITAAIYALNIIDANVDAHLLQFNVDENLSFTPHYQYNAMENSSDLGLTFNFKF